MDYIWIFVILGIVGLFVFLYLRTKKKRQGKDEQDVLDSVQIPNVPQNWEFSEATPLGARVLWNGNPFNSEDEKKFVFECFDVGFRNAMNAMIPKFPTWDFNPGFINIAIIDGTATNMDGSKALRTKQGIQAAGAVIGTDDLYPLVTIVVPSQKENGWSYPDLQMRTAWHEYEHFQEFRSDTMEFLKWGRTPEFPDNHPHHPLPADIPEIPAPTRG